MNPTLPRRRISAAVLAALAVVSLAPVAARAQDSYNPFSDVPASSRSQRRGPPAEAARGGGEGAQLAPVQAPSAAGYDGGGRSSPNGYQPAPWESRPAAQAAPYQPPPWETRQAPAAAPAGPAAGGFGRGVERGELAPIPGTATDTRRPAGSLSGAASSGLPADVWRGLDMARIEALLARLEVPPRSPALHSLWRRLMTTEAAPPDGATTENAFESLRLESLLRSGLVREVADELGRRPEALREAGPAMMLARSELALGHRDKACAIALGQMRTPGGASKAVRQEVVLFNGYCAAAGGNKAGAGLTADMAREAGFDAPSLALLDTVAAGGKPKVGANATVSLIEFKLIEFAGGLDPAKVVGQAKPALLAALASDSGTGPALRVAAAEAAARLNAITPESLGEVYRAAPQNRSDTASTRAELYRTAVDEANPQRKARLIRGFLDEERRAGLYLPGLVMMGKASDALVAVPEIGWYAETAVEVALAAGNYESARRWIGFGQTLDRPGGASGEIGGWLALADIADAEPRGDRVQSLAIIEQLALKGRFKPEFLHRLATVLDAMDYQVPIPLWEAASRTPQPAGGHLPATGVLTELQDAAKKKEIGRTVLLVMDTLGPDGAEGAHMIALGDSIRALRRAGLERDARRMGFEALLAQWPRSVTN